MSHRARSISGVSGGEKRKREEKGIFSQKIKIKKKELRSTRRRCEGGRRIFCFRSRPRAAHVICASQPQVVSVSFCGPLETSKQNLVLDYDGRLLCEAFGGCLLEVGGFVCLSSWYWTVHSSEGARVWE